MALIDRIEELILSDDEYPRDDQSDRLIDEYEKASPESKEVIDNIFICLCGYSLKSIIEQY
jgi:hypothetical protein